MVKGPKDEEPTIRLINSVVFFSQSGGFAGNAKAETFGFNSLPNYYGPGADGPQIYLLFYANPENILTVVANESVNRLLSYTFWEFKISNCMLIICTAIL